MKRRRVDTRSLETLSRLHQEAQEREQASEEARVRYHNNRAIALTVFRNIRKSFGEQIDALREARKSGASL